MLDPIGYMLKEKRSAFTGGTTVDTHPVRFIDYDGSVVYAYTQSEFQALNALPANPTHEGLISQGWNWSLEEAKAHVGEHCGLDIGQRYITASGATEIDITLENPDVKPYLHIFGEATIDWGDGVTEEVSGNVYKQHVYEAGSYTIKITGEIAFRSAFNFPGVFSCLAEMCMAPAYADAVKAIRLGENVTIGNYAFSRCGSMEYITIPDYITEVGEGAFAHCFELKSIILPNVPRQVCFNAFGLKYASASNGIESVGWKAFQSCFNLAGFAFPESVEAIGADAFANCRHAKAYYFKTATPPVLAGSNTIAYSYDDATVYVPNTETYQSSTNYPSYLSYDAE